MAKYELGAIYKINRRSGELYYVRLLTNDCYGVFSSLEGELNEETFAQTHYRLYFSCNSFPIKRGIWEKVVSSPNCTDIARWQRPQYLANFANFNMKLFLDQCRVFHEDGNLYQCESKEEFIRLVKSGKILFCFNTYEIIPDFLMRYYKDFPNSYIVNKDFIHSGTLEYQKEQTNVLKEKLNNIKDIQFVVENEDKTKKYIIKGERDIDLRKEIFETLSKEGITIFEMKKADATLEDAFMKLINDSTNSNNTTEENDQENQNDDKDEKEISEKENKKEDK